MVLKDLSQLRNFIAENDVTAYITEASGLFGGYHLIFLSGKYKFGLSTQKRNDRTFSLRLFRTVETALTVLRKLGIKGKVNLML